MAEASAPSPSTEEHALRAEIARLNKVVTALMNHAERSASVQGSDFGLFQTAVMLENQVRHRTTALEAAVRENAKVNRALHHAKAQMELDIAERRQTQISLEHEKYEQHLLIMQLELAHQRLLQAQKEQESLSRQQAQALSLLNATLQASPDGVAVFSLTGELIAYNHNYVQLWQLDATLLNAGDPQALRRHCERQLKMPLSLGTQWPLESADSCEEVLRADGRIVERHVSPQFVAGEQTGVVVHWHDVTERKQEEAKRNRMTHILERSLNEIYLFDPVTLRFEYANAGALANLGYDLATLRQMTPVDLKPAYDESSFRQMLQPLLTGETELMVMETIHRRADGSVYDVQIHLQLDSQDQKPLLMALILDISERKRAEALIWSQANFDHLTQLPNRSMLQDRMAQEIAKAQRNGCKLAVLFIDLDKFKEINDTLGHDKGDQLLREAAQRIRAGVRASDTVARMGGDEFVVLLADLFDGRMASDVAQTLIDALSLPFDLCGTEAVVSGSIGITLYPDDALSGEGLLKNADQAMYVSKTRGRNQFSYFTRALEQAAQRRMVMMAQLRQALAQGQFFLNFQPIVDLSNGNIHKAEALIRWQHPELGLVSPLEFIGLAEETGLIVPIGDWVFDEAVRWVQRWRQRFHADFQVSVNKSPVQFLREKEPSKSWTYKLRQQGLPGRCICMEITESLLIDGNHEVLASLQGCRQAGIEVAIDDFGTGYSSLAYLKRFEVDTVKIDRSFVSNLAPGSSDLALSQAIIVMAHALGLKVVAEGVETKAQLALLRQAGCDYAQGYLFSRPLGADEFERWLERNPTMTL